MEKEMKKYLVSQFGKPRGIFGKLIGWVMAIKNRKRVLWTISQLQISDHDRILEIGFGPGAAIHEISKIVKNGAIAGIDHSKIMLHQASRRNFRAIKSGQVELKQGSSDSLPYPEDYFNKVFGINVNLFWKDPSQNMKELKRVLKPRGKLAIILQPHWAKTEEAIQAIGKQLLDQFLKIGFTNVNLKSQKLRSGTCLLVEGTK
jgi:ubiquinone/menaquinone biosynthesis C-methylase UbiE